MMLLNVQSFVLTADPGEDFIPQYLEEEPLLIYHTKFYIIKKSGENDLAFIQVNVV